MGISCFEGVLGLRSISALTMIIEGEEDKMARWDAHQRLELQGSGLSDHVRCLLPFAWKPIACSRCCFAYLLSLKLLYCHMQRLSTIFFVSYGLRSLSLRPSIHCAKSRNSLPKLYCISTKWTVRFLYRTQRGKCAHERVVLRASSNLHASSMVGPF